MSPPIWIRNYAVKKEETFHVIPLLITLVAIGYIGCFLAGNAGKVLDPNLTDSNNLIPSLLVKYGSQISITLLFCGFAAASLSTANSQIHALSAIYTVDIHKKFSSFSCFCLSFGSINPRSIPGQKISFH